MSRSALSAYSLRTYFSQLICSYIFVMSRSALSACSACTYFSGLSFYIFQVSRFQLTNHSFKMILAWSASIVLYYIYQIFLKFNTLLGFYSSEFVSHQRSLMVSHWSFSDSKSPYVFRTLFSILVSLYYTVVLVVSSFLLIS